LQIIGGQKEPNIIIRSEYMNPREYVRFWTLETLTTFIVVYFIQIYPVSEGYLRKILVERRGKYPEPL
jgi:hypothetical protein